jgi:hypothetical protein
MPSNILFMHSVSVAPAGRFNDSAAQFGTELLSVLRSRLAILKRD